MLDSEPGRFVHRCGVGEDVYMIRCAWSSSGSDIAVV